MNENTLYEIAIENRTNIKHLIKQYEDTNGLIKELLNEQKNCPGRMHAIKAEGAGALWARAALIIAMICSLFGSFWAVFEAKK